MFVKRCHHQSVSFNCHFNQFTSFLRQVAKNPLFKTFTMLATTSKLSSSIAAPTSTANPPTSPTSDPAITPQTPPRRSDTMGRPESKRVHLNPFTIAQAIVLVLIIVAFAYQAFDLPSVRTCPSESTAGWQDTLISTASQGKLWKPKVSRQFPYALKFQRSTSTKSLTPPLHTGPTCSKWAVVTTIFSPTKLLHQLRDMADWCLVVVGDKKTNDTEWDTFAEHSSQTTVYLSADKQDNLPYESLRAIPWNHFGRKNVGYLYAIHHGADLIWDTDDDNDLLEPSEVDGLSDMAQSSYQIALLNNRHHLWNPYPHFNPIAANSGSPQDVCWPRGLPLPYVKDAAAAYSCKSPQQSCNSSKTIPVARVGVFQSLANNDPDVDALYRLTRPLPLSFHPVRDAQPVALPALRVAPFNAQATLWRKHAFWALLLPVTVHGRVSDIWRSYFAQRLFSDTNIHVAFTPPLAIQYRNVHTLVADLQAEIPLYTQADELVKWLHDWHFAGDSDSLPGRVEKLMADLFEIGVIERDDVQLTQAWLKDLHTLGYEFANISTRLPVKRDMPEADGSYRPRVATCMRVNSVNSELSEMRRGVTERDADADVDLFVLGDPNSSLSICEGLEDDVNSCTIVDPAGTTGDAYVTCAIAVREREAIFGAFDWLNVDFEGGASANATKRHELVLMADAPTVWTSANALIVSGRADWTIDFLTSRGEDSVISRRTLPNEIMKE